MIGALIRHMLMKKRVVQSSWSCADNARHGVLAKTAETGAESAETETISCDVSDSRFFCVCISCL